MLYRVPVLLVSFMVHELSHALAALRCGDTTAKDMGRINFNPVRHIDPIGALLLLVAGFGWAKPVPINPDNFKHKKPGIIATSLAGPFSNILLSIIFGAAYIIYFTKIRRVSFLPPEGAQQIALTLLYQFYIINIMLASFNLIPIPPLDGSKVLFSLLPDRIYFDYVLRYERYGFIVLLALSFSGLLMKILGPVIGALSSFVEIVINPISRLFL